MRCVQIVLNQHDLLGHRKVNVAEIAQDLRIVDGCAPVGDLDMAPAFERRKQHEEIGRAIAPVFVVVAPRLSRPHGLAPACLGDELLARFIEADQLPGRLVRPRIDVEHILHRSDKGGVGFRRDHPVVGQVRF